MFNLSPKTYLFAFLVFCVFSSKNIIIYNEETLVTLSFFLFVLFVFHYFGNTVKESLDERSQGIKAECQNFLHYKQRSLQELAVEYKKIGQLQGALTELMLFTKSTGGQLTRTGAQSLETAFSQQLMQKCSELRGGQLQQRLQALMAHNQLSLVLVRCANQGKGLPEGREKSGNLDSKVLKSAVQLLTATGKKS